jgi:hypothetical protein
MQDVVVTAKQAAERTNRMDHSTIIEYLCAYCGEPNEVEIDLTAGTKQSFTEDCAVCCRPNSIVCVIDTDGNVTLSVEFEG